MSRPTRSPARCSRGARAAAGVVYSLAYGDQPALIAEQVDWARAAGFDVVAAGKGTKYLPEYHASTPDTVWAYYGLTPEEAAEGGMNPQMFNSFLDGTKSAIEMAAVANATGLEAAPDGLGFPPAGVDDLPRVLRPRADGRHASPEGPGRGRLQPRARRLGRCTRDLRWGVYVVVEAPTDYVARCFGEYGLVTDDSGRYTAMYKPFHLIGLELGISVASVGAAPRADRRADGLPRATRSRSPSAPLKPGEVLDGEGGYMVWGRLMPAADSLARGALPIGLAHHVKIKSPVAAGTVLRYADVEIDRNDGAARVRRELELAYGGEATPVAAQ